MDDSDLAAGMGLKPEEAAIILPRLSPERRAAYKRLISLADELNLWSAGLGPKPQGAIVCAEHKRSRR